MQRERIRNFGIAAHIDAGKTTVSERMLVHTGVEHRAGRVDEGTAVLDWMTEERERGITITAAATRLPWRDYALNLIDTPGHVDFTVEVERCMRVLDGAVLVLDGVMGVQAQSETVWRQMDRYGVPCIVFVNKLDRPGADFLHAAGTLQTHFGVRALPVQVPVMAEGGPTHLVDLVDLRVWDERGEGERPAPSPGPIPDEVADEVGVLRAELLEALAEVDEEILARLCADESPEPEVIRAALRRRVLDRSLVPVFAGAALKDVGVRPLLDAVVDYLPSPLDVPPVRGLDPESDTEIVRRCDPDEPLAALAFKIHASAHGDLTFVRVYSGRLLPGKAIQNPRGRRKERPARVLRVHAEATRSLDEAEAGDIVAVTGLKWTGTGDTLCDPKAPIVLERLEFPEPVITIVVEPESAAERDKLGEALERLAHEDPSLRVRADEDTGQWIVSGMGELHLEVVRHRLEQEFRIHPRVGQPRVAYREAVVGEASASGRVDRVVGGKEIFGAIDLVLEPDPDRLAPTVVFEEACGVPTAFRPAIEEALALEAQVGPRFGYPLVHARIRIVGSESREGRDAELGFVQAAVSALRQAMHQAAVALQEPVMEFEIQTPAEFASGIIADLGARHADLSDVGAEGEVRTIRGQVPLSEMFGYSTAIRSLSQGRAGFSMHPAGYREVPEAELAARGLSWS